MTDKIYTTALLETSQSYTHRVIVAPPVRTYHGQVLRRDLLSQATKPKSIQVVKRESLTAPADPLAHITAAIEASRSILALEDDWDGNGSERYDESTWKLATGFLAAQAAYVWSAKVKLRTPDIAPGPKGSIDLVWQEEDFRLLINVPPAATALGYWGQNKALTVKGTITDLGADHKELFLWLTKRS